MPWTRGWGLQQLCFSPQPSGGMGRFLLNNSASRGGGFPPPSDPDFIVGNNEILQKEVLIWLFLVQIFGLLGSRSPPPPPTTPPTTNNFAWQ